MMPGKDAVHPFTLAEAATDPRIMPNHRVYLTKSQYTLPANLTFTRPGAKYAPLSVAVRPLWNIGAVGAGELGIMVSGDDVEIRNVEIAGVDPVRVSTQVGGNLSSPDDITLGQVETSGKRVAFRGCIIHDIKMFFVGETADGFIFEDCLIYNQGWDGSDRMHGHAFYSQNAGVVAHEIKNCIFGQGFGFSVHFYGSETSLLDGLHIDKTIFINPFFLVGGEEGAVLDDISVTDSVFFELADTGQHFGYIETEAGTLTLTGNYYGIQAPTILDIWDTVTNTGNVTGVGGANVVKVFACNTPPWVCHFAVMNWQELSSVSVSMTGMGMVQGNSYRLRQALDPLVDTSIFVYDGSGSISVSFVGRTIAKPYGHPTALITIDPRFGVWTLEAA